MNLLFVSLAFPPKNDPECIQTGRYFKYLSKDRDLAMDVVTSASPTLFMPIDDGLRKYDSGYRQKVEIPLFESKVMNFALRKAGLHAVLFPDSKMTFHWRWRMAVEQLRVIPDVIYSRSNPMSSAMMAMKLKKNYQVPWVMHMSDPWAISPLDDMPDVLRKRSLKTENEFLGLADKVIFTSSQALNFYAARYSGYASKFAVLPNVYDADNIGEVKPMDSNKLKIVYTGGLSGNRNACFLEKVLKEAIQRDPEVTQVLEFVFAGDMDRGSRAFFDKVHPCIRHLGMLSQEEAKSLCASAHVLLVIDNPTDSQGAIFFPSKLLDYFLMKRQIWAVTPANSVTRDVLKDANHVAFQHAEIQEMADYLIDAVNHFRMAESSFFLSNNVPKQFSAEINAGMLSSLLKEAGTRH